jgi:predicted alpha/beta-hydrolase family hydrolase
VSGPRIDHDFAATPDAVELSFLVSEGIGRVSALLLAPSELSAMLVLGHGAGAGMRHAFMESMARALARDRIGTFRYQFPYMEAGRRAPNRAPILMETVRAAVLVARERTDALLIAGGKSMGGRMTSQAAAAEGLEGVRGLVFFGFPLHRPGEPSSERARHLSDVERPMLFLQGTRDRLADLELLRRVCAGLGTRATLHVVEGADHSFRLPKRLGRTEDDVFAELAQTVKDWAAGI